MTNVARLDLIIGVCNAFEARGNCRIEGQIISDKQTPKFLTWTVKCAPECMLHSSSEIFAPMAIVTTAKSKRDPEVESQVSQNDEPRRAARDDAVGRDQISVRTIYSGVSVTPN